MHKQEFLTQLRKELSGLPQNEIEERIAFYGEMIDDRIEEGQTEEDAVLAVGSVEDIAAQIIADIPLTKIAKERLRPKKRLGAWEILLLVLGSPIWLSLAVAVFSVILALYAVLWSVIVSVWAIFISLAACALGGIAGGTAFAFSGYTFTSAALIGAGICCAGLSVFLFFGCKASTNGIILLTKKIALGIKRCFVKKEEAR